MTTYSHDSRASRKRKGSSPPQRKEPRSQNNDLAKKLSRKAQHLSKSTYANASAKPTTVPSTLHVFTGMAPCFNGFDQANKKQIAEHYKIEPDDILLIELCERQFNERFCVFHFKTSKAFQQYLANPQCPVYRFDRDRRHGGWNKNTRVEQILLFDLPHVPESQHEQLRDEIIFNLRSAQQEASFVVKGIRVYHTKNKRFTIAKIDINKPATTAIFKAIEQVKFGDQFLSPGSQQVRELRRCLHCGGLGHPSGCVTCPLNHEVYVVHTSYMNYSYQQQVLTSMYKAESVSVGPPKAPASASEVLTLRFSRTRPLRDAFQYIDSAIDDTQIINFYQFNPSKDCHKCGHRKPKHHPSCEHYIPRTPENLVENEPPPRDTPPTPVPTESDSPAPQEKCHIHTAAVPDETSISQISTAANFHSNNLTLKSDFQKNSHIHADSKPEQHVAVPNEATPLTEAYVRSLVQTGERIRPEMADSLLEHIETTYKEKPYTQLKATGRRHALFAREEQHKELRYDFPGASAGGMISNPPVGPISAATDQIICATDITNNATSVFVNAYENGNNWCPFHSDYTDRNPYLHENVYMLALGAPRKFTLQHKNRKLKNIEFNLEHGFIYHISSYINEHFVHSRTKQSKSIGFSASLTTRNLTAIK